MPATKTRWGSTLYGRSRVTAALLTAAALLPAAPLTAEAERSADCGWAGAAGVGAVAREPDGEQAAAPSAVPSASANDRTRRRWVMATSPQAIARLIPNGTRGYIPAVYGSRYTPAADRAWAEPPGGGGVPRA